jgi:hypothetical protein
MRASGTFTPADLARTEAQVSRALTDAGLPAGAARAWLSSAAGRLQDEAQWSLDYDTDLQVATFEVWKDGRMLFGLDDWLPQG